MQQVNFVLKLYEELDSGHLRCFNEQKDMTKLLKFNIIIFNLSQQFRLHSISTVNSDDTHRY